jgi:integrase
MATSPASVNLIALPTRLIRTCVRRRPSPWPGGKSGASSSLNASFFYRQREYLTETEVDRLIEAARKRGRNSTRDSAAILLAYRHGLRAAELYSLRWSQIDLRHGRLHVNRAKGGIESVHPLHGPELFTVIARRTLHSCRTGCSRSPAMRPIARYLCSCAGSVREARDRSLAALPYSETSTARKP